MSTMTQQQRQAYYVDNMNTEHWSATTPGWFTTQPRYQHTLIVVNVSRCHGVYATPTAVDALL